jgi:hypothetical protein
MRFFYNRFQMHLVTQVDTLQHTQIGLTLGERSFLVNSKDVIILRVSNVLEKRLARNFVWMDDDLARHRWLGDQLTNVFDATRFRSAFSRRARHSFIVLGQLLGSTLASVPMNIERVSQRMIGLSCRLHGTCL